MSTTRKTILIFIDWFDPAYKAGGPVVSIRNLALALQSEVSFFIYTGNREYQSGEELDVAPNKWVTYDENIKVHYASKVSSKSISEVLQTVLPDIVYLNGMFSWSFSILPLINARRLKIKVILAPRGMLSKGSLGVKSMKKKVFLIVMKSLYVYKNVKFHATSRQEEQDVLSHFGQGSSICFAQNLPRTHETEATPIPKERSELNMILVGRIAAEKNILNAIKVLKGSPSGVKLDIYGPVYDAKYKKQCELVIEELNLEDRIKFMGSISPDRLEIAFKKYQVFMLPSSGENYGHAIIEAMFSGLPVIISDQTPWRNLSQNKAGYDIAVENLSAYKKAIDTFYGMGQAEFKEWSENARQYAISNTENPEILEQNRDLFSLS
ncbi:MAG: glycosyltransferase [Vicingaceae bacterium]